MVCETHEIAEMDYNLLAVEVGEIAVPGRVIEKIFFVCLSAFGT